MSSLNLPRLLLRLILGARLPTTRGSLAVPGIRDTVRIRRDGWGIPYVDARNEADAWYSLGFCHGQDRTFQLESLLRVIRGTVAEMAGPDGLPIDRLSRRIGFRRASERQIAVLGADTRELMEAYAAGVNAGIRRGRRRRPHELVLLRADPAPWDAVDVVGMFKLQSFYLSSNWDAELARLQILNLDGPEALQALDPVYPAWLPITAPPGAAAGPAADRLAEDLAAFSRLVGVGGASNNWAIAGVRSASGRPLLANDPHLSPTLPPHWYLAHLRTPDWAVAGASFVGTLSFPAGHNGFAAWGITAGLADTTDLFLEELGPDGRSVRQGDGYVPCEVRLERIKVKGGEAVEEEVLITPRGPIVGPALAEELGAISLRATWLEPLPVRGLIHAYRAAGFEEFRRHFEEWPGLSLNVVYADTDGAIGWQLIGDVPRRRTGWGTIPQPGWDPATSWEDAPVPFDEMPHLANPPQGWVATANNQPLPSDGQPFLGVDWLDGYRLARIDEALQSRNDWDVDGAMALQMDLLSIPWREMRAAVLEAGAGRALNPLTAWDGRVAPDSPAATVFELFLQEMCRRLVVAKAPRSDEWAAGKGFPPLFPFTTFGVRRSGYLARLLKEQPEGWLERSWKEEIADALQAVLERLESAYGPDEGGWAWGRVRPLVLRHPLGVRPTLGRIFNLGPSPWGGDANTVSQASVDPLDATANPGFIASLRMVVDVGAWSQSRFVLPGGQSGNPLSPHYADQLPLWQRGEGIPIVWSPEEISRAAVDLLQLTPGQPD